jgi:hypothetical protein
VSQARIIRGNFNPSSGAFNPAFGGPYVLSSRVGFEPLGGRFVPSPGGPFALTVPQVFNPNTGRFAPSPIGNFVLQTRGNFIPNTGSFTRTAMGTFNPITGGFVPGNNGAFTLSTRGVFVPSNGTFVPSPVGNFVLTSRQAFDPRTGGFVASPNGNFTTMTRGSFIPASRFANAAGLPRIPVDPLSPLNTTGLPAISPFFSAFNNPATAGFNPAFAAFNPYYSATAPFAPFAAASSYLPNPYLPGGNYGSSYGSSYGPPNAYQNPQAYAANYNSAPAYSNAPAYNPAPPQAAKQQSPLDAFGIPSENGGIAWPLAFRLMSPVQRRDLREPAETQLAAAATQAAAGQANPNIVDEARLSVARLRQWLRSRRTDLAEGTYSDAARFLQRADDALDSMTAPGARPMSPYASK